MFRQHRAQDRLSTPVVGEANLNRASPSIIAEVGLARSQAFATHCWDIPARRRSDATLIVYSQAFSSMRASPRLGCAMGVPRDLALNAPLTRVHPAPPSIEGGSVPGHQSSTSGASVTNASCQYPLCGRLAVLDMGGVRGPRRDAAAPLTHSGDCAAYRTFQNRRYNMAVGARHCLRRWDASEWRRVTPVGLLHEMPALCALPVCVTMLCDTYCTMGCHVITAVLGVVLLTRLPVPAECRPSPLPSSDPWAIVSVIVRRVRRLYVPSLVYSHY
jgi:hypothetical protein